MSSDAEVTLSLTWLNRTALDGSQLVIDLRVDVKKSFNFYLKPLFEKTVELETARNSNYVPCSYKPFNIQIFTNGTELTLQELRLPLRYILAPCANRESPPIYFNTSHCGALLLFSRPCKSTAGASSLTENNFVPLTFELGFHTIEDLKSELDAVSAEKLDYIFSDSEILCSPSDSHFQRRMLRNHFKQCDLVIYGTLNSEGLDEAIASIAEKESKSLRVFGDVTADPEAIPLGKEKWLQPKKGLNLIGSCSNASCQLSQNGVRPVVHWNRPSFDISVDLSSVICPKCSSVLSSLSPAFYLTQWKYYGQKIAGAEAKENTQSDSEGVTANEGSGSDAELELLTCDWQIADDKCSYSGFTIVDSPGITIGLAEWTKLFILTRPMPKSAGKRFALQEKYNFGLKVDIPLVFSVAVNFDWFRDFRK